MAALVWAGCVHYRAQPIVPARTAAALSARSLDDEGLRRFLAQNLGREPVPWPPTAWDFDLLALAAYYYQPSLDVARAEWRVAAAGEVTAGERPNPSVSLTPTYDTTTSPPWIPGISFDVPIETAGKRGYRLAQAQHLADAARWNILATVWEVRSGVRAALLDLYAARRSASLLARQEAAQARVVRLLEAQLAAGNVAGPEVTPARIALDTTRLAHQQASREDAEALAGLAAALGVPAAALQDVPLSFAGLDQFPTALTAPEVRRQAILNRADIRGALAEYAASQAVLQLEIANQYPDVHLGPGYELDQTDNKWTLGVSFTLPLLNQNQGAMGEARAQQELAAAHFLAVQAKAIGEIDLALAGYSAARQQSATAAALAGHLKHQLNSVRAMQVAGEVDALAVANAEVEYNAGALAHLDALVKAQQALGQLENAMQSPLVPPASPLPNAETNSRQMQPSTDHEP